MKQPYPNNIAALRNARGMTMAELGEAIGADPSTINKLEKGRMEITASRLKRLMHTFDVTAEEVLGEPVMTPLAVHKPRKIHPELASRSFPNPANRLPVYGLAAASIAGNLTMTNDPVEWVLAPAPLSTVRDAYALRVIGSSMEPRYFPGDVIFIHPHKPPVAGDHVVIQEEMNGGTSVSVKRYDRTNESHIITTQYNPLAEIKFLRSRVMAVHRVLTPNETSGI